MRRSARVREPRDFFTSKEFNRRIRKSRESDEPPSPEDEDEYDEENDMVEELA